jgi:uncharacterized membrane protein
MSCQRRFGCLGTMAVIRLVVSWVWQATLASAEYQQQLYFRKMGKHMTKWQATGSIIIYMIYLCPGGLRSRRWSMRSADTNSAKTRAESR